MPDFQDLIEQTKQLNQEFQKRGNQYDKRSRLIDLMEEVGELAQAVHIVEGFKRTNDPAKAKTKADIADGLADILYELILLSLDYDLDLESEYRKMLDQLGKRLKNGEFD